MFNLLSSRFIWGLSYLHVAATFSHAPKLSSLYNGSNGVVSGKTFVCSTQCCSLFSTKISVEDATDEEKELLSKIRSMSVKELKSELQSLAISTKDAFEKEELVKRLYQARGENNSVTRTSSANDDDNGGGNVDNVFYGAVDQNEVTKKTIENKESKTSHFTNSKPCITAPFLYYELESSKSVAAANAPNTFLRPSQGKYAAVKVRLAREDGDSVEWTLLVDTACSGIVLSPKAIARAEKSSASKIKPLIQKMPAARATMMAAGGAQGGHDVVQWNGYTTRLEIGGAELPDIPTMPTVAVVQDIGALPGELDGILGLSFLNQFACVDFDFSNNQLRLHKDESNPPLPMPSNNNYVDGDLFENLKSDEQNNILMAAMDSSLVAQSPLSLTNMGIYTIQTTLDGRGPVRLLVDTGAASSFLNWKGVSAMNLSRSSQHIEPIRESIGAMGADNMALTLSHRFILKRRWNLGGGANSSVGGPGVGLRETQINLDIGDLPVLKALESEGVGGILGADLLMMCDVVRFSELSGRSLTMKLFKY